MATFAQVAIFCSNTLQREGTSVGINNFRYVLFVVTLLIVGLAVGSSGSSASGGVPAGYPDDYAEIIEASKHERGLLIYSNMAAYNWAPVIKGFNELYPWIKVETLDLGSGEVFERFLSEKATRSATGDLLVSASPDNWLDLIKVRDEVLPYDSPERANLPDWSLPMPGLYTVSTDPTVIVYNKLLLPEELRPRGIAHMAELAAAHPHVFNGKITTYVITNAFGYAANWAFARDAGFEETWRNFEVFGPMVRPENSGGPQVEKVVTGEYVVGYFTSGIQVFTKLEDLSAVLDFSYFEDGQPMFMRGVGIPKVSANMNSAKLMLDYMISLDGQVAFGHGGLVPYRPGVENSDVPRSYQSIVAEVGEENIVLIDYDENSAPNAQAFKDRWDRVFGR